MKGTTPIFILSIFIAAVLLLHVVETDDMFRKIYNAVQYCK
jgi:hypothetical protein